MVNREAERKRLVELKSQFVENFDCGDCQPENEKCRKCLSEKEADHLLDNGIVVPPVKVGQTIYYHFQFRNKSILPFTRKAKVKKIYCSNNKMGFVVDAELIDAKEKGIMKSFDFDDFGKTVFTSREDAQKALEGSGEK